jgi:hypothetical protein
VETIEPDVTGAAAEGENREKSCQGGVQKVARTGKADVVPSASGTRVDVRPGGEFDRGFSLDIPFRSRKREFGSHHQYFGRRRLGLSSRLVLDRVVLHAIPAYFCTGLRIRWNSTFMWVRSGLLLLGYLKMAEAIGVF